jgi:thiamine transport system substrate-binding protein
MNKRVYLLLALALIAGLIAACTPTADTTEPRTLTVMTHDSFAVSEALVTQFEAENNVKVSFVRSGDTGAALNKAILSKENPLADVFYGVDNTFLTRALEEGIFEAYDSPLLAEIPDSFKIDPGHFALPVDYGDVCINYDKAYFEEHGLVVPTSLEELAQPEYQGLLAVDNEVVVVNDWETAYYTNFSASSGQGPQPMIVSYGSSPPVEVYYAETELEDAPTASIIGPNTCFRQIEFAGILKGTPNRDLAEAFIDFMLGADFQSDIPLQMFVFPVNPNATLPDVFTQYAQISDQPATLDPALIDANRETWINAWTEIVLE